MQYDFASHQRTIWEWGDTITKGVRVPSLVAILSRGGGKSTTAELLAVRQGATKRRRYILYVRATQDQADRSIDNIASLLESPIFSQSYPYASKKSVNKYGQSKGWRRNRLRAANGMTIDAFGLDAALRGAKVEEARPDLIILDDIDEKHDSIKITTKKIETLTMSILPAGSSDFAVCGIQNMVLSNGVFARLASGEADFLQDRILIGPVPAIENLEYEQRYDEKLKRSRFMITGGTATWAGQDIKTCENQINDWGLMSFLAEAQHDVDASKDGTYSGVVFEHCSMEDVPELKRRELWVDPAVTDSDDADCMGIQVDGITREGKIYRLYSWEDRTNTRAVLRRAFLKGFEYRVHAIGVETDQGGDLWKGEYDSVYSSMVAAKELPKGWGKPTFKAAKAGAIGSKRHRHNMMRSAYDRGEFIHVLGTNKVLENALSRFPLHKPFDLADASFWSWRSLRMTRGWSRGFAQ